MAAQGILAKELDHKGTDEIRIMLQEREHRYDIPNEAVELRYNAAEKRREYMYDLIVKERQRLITDAKMKSLMAENFEMSKISRQDAHFKSG